jgi:hypothetical protein
MVQLNEKGYEKMPDNIFTDLDANVAQLNALMEVIKEITKPLPLVESYELGARVIIKKLQNRLDDCNVLDDSDLVDLLTDAIAELKYLVERLRLLCREIDNMPKAGN